MNSTCRALVVCIATATLSACSAAYSSDGHDITAVNGTVEAEAGKSYGTLSTVNGNVRVGRGATADKAKTVNGSIEIEDDARVGTASTVNGSLRVGAGAAINESAATVNGEVKLRARSRVGGDVSSVNGELDLEGAEVAGKLITRSGDIELSDGARVRGGIHVQKRNDSGWSWGQKDPIKVHVCGTCVVDGELRFDQPVELRVDEGGKIGAVVGEQVTRR
jgi:DUF4097 and DUF4098 domain-containing protein YvlB